MTTDPKSDIPGTWQKKIPDWATKDGGLGWICQPKKKPQVAEVSITDSQLFVLTHPHLIGFGQVGLWYSVPLEAPKL